MYIYNIDNTSTHKYTTTIYIYHITLLYIYNIYIYYLKYYIYIPLPNILKFQQIKFLYFPIFLFFPILSLSIYIPNIYPYPIPNIQSIHTIHLYCHTLYY